MGEEYGFFGGAIEEGETSEDALKREIKEELGIEVKEHSLFCHDIIFIPEVGGEVERNVFLAPLPNISNLKVKEGRIKFVDFNEINKLKMVSGDAELLNKIKYFLLKK